MSETDDFRTKKHRLSTFAIFQAKGSLRGSFQKIATVLRKGRDGEKSPKKT